MTDESAAGRHELVVGGLTYLGQVAGTYLVLRDASGALMLLDQHAAHERVLYERLRKGAFAGTAQCLALPLELALQPVEEERFLEVRDNLERMGFDVSCSGGRLLARGIPPSLSRSAAARTTSAPCSFPCPARAPSRPGSVWPMTRPRPCCASGCIRRSGNTAPTAVPASCAGMPWRWRNCSSGGSEASGPVCAAALPYLRERHVPVLTASRRTAGSSPPGSFLAVP